MAQLREVKIVSVNSPWESYEDEYNGRVTKMLQADVTFDSGHGDEEGPFRTASKKLADAVDELCSAGKPCSVSSRIFKDQDSGSFGVVAQAKENPELVPPSEGYGGGGGSQPSGGGSGGRRGGGGSNPERDRLIVAQVAYKGAVEALCAGKIDEGDMREFAREGFSIMFDVANKKDSELPF